MPAASVIPTPHIADAPGSRVLIRDAKWIIRRVNRCYDGGQQLVCDGVSELFRDREALFLTALEPKMEVLDPVETWLVRDDSPGFVGTHHLEGQLRQAVPSEVDTWYHANGRILLHPQQWPLRRRDSPEGRYGGLLLHPWRHPLRYPARLEGHPRSHRGHTHPHHPRRQPPGGLPRAHDYIRSPLHRLRPPEDCRTTWVAFTERLADRSD